MRFSEGGALLHFGTAPRPEPEAEDETLDEDRVALDIWNWQDAYLQPMQLVQAEDERQRTYEAAVHLDGGAVVQLGTIDVPAVRFAADTDAAHALGVTDRPYRQLLSWDGRYNDLYAVDPPPYGSAGWTADDGAFLFYDRFDVWRFEPDSGRTVNLTAGKGRESNTRFRYARTEPELHYIPEGEALWHAFHDTNKRGGFYRGRADRETSPAEVVMADKSFRLRGKAKDADRWLLTREDFREFPDLWVTDGGIAEMQRMSDANPQQKDYRWGSAEARRMDLQRRHPTPGHAVQARRLRPRQGVSPTGVLLRADVRRRPHLADTPAGRLIHLGALLRQPGLRGVHSRHPVRDRLPGRRARWMRSSPACSD